jgi:hypothetical protein
MSSRQRSPPENAIDVPSGDQVGEQSSRVLFVTLVWPLPSVAIKKISKSSREPRLVAKAIWPLPAGCAWPADPARLGETARARATNRPMPTTASRPS